MFEFPIYSPVEELKLPLLDHLGIQLFVKRDDMIHPFISGNKWRKLKYNLITAQSQGKTHLVTFGGIWSNHLVATACAASKFGFKSTAFVRGEDLNTESLFLCRMFGMKLIFTDREAYRNKAELFRNTFEDDVSAYFIDEGGAGEEAVRGCSELISELNQHYDHLFCAAGTGSTAAGLLHGILSHNYNSILNVVPVLKGGDFIRDELNKYNPGGQYGFYSDYHFGGYAKTSPELLQFIANFCSSTGILLDPVYTGKMMYAIFDLARRGTFEKGSKILAIHTGGLFGLLGMKEQFRF